MKPSFIEGGVGGYGTLQRLMDPPDPLSGDGALSQEWLQCHLGTRMCPHFLQCELSVHYNCSYSTIRLRVYEQAIRCIPRISLQLQSFTEFQNIL